MARLTDFAKLRKKMTLLRVARLTDFAKAMQTEPNLIANERRFVLLLLWLVVAFYVVLKMIEA